MTRSFKPTWSRWYNDSVDVQVDSVSETRFRPFDDRLAKDVSIVRSFIVAFRSAKERQNATFAKRKATLTCRKMLSYPKEGHRFD